MTPASCRTAIDATIPGGICMSISVCVSIDRRNPVGYLRSLFLALTIAVQLVTLAYVLVVMGNTQTFDPNRSIVNTTDARALYFLGTVALTMTAGLAVMLWLERRSLSCRAAVVAASPQVAPVRSSRRSRSDGSSTTDSGGDSTDRDSRGDGDRDGTDAGGSDGRTAGAALSPSGKDESAVDVDQALPAQGHRAGHRQSLVRACAKRCSRRNGSAIGPSFQVSLRPGTAVSI